MVIKFEQHRLSNSFASHVLNFSGGSWACQLDTDRHRPRSAVAPSRCRYYPLLQCADFDAQPLHAWILDWALETRWQDETSEGMASNKLRLQRRSKSLKQNSLGAPDCATGWQAQNFTIFSVIFYRFFINQLRSHWDQAPSWMRLVMWWRNCWRTIWLAAWWQMAGMDSVIFQRYCTSRGSCAKSSTLQDFARCYRWHSCAAWTWIRPQPVLPSTMDGFYLSPKLDLSASDPRFFFDAPWLHLQRWIPTTSHMEFPSTKPSLLVIGSQRKSTGFSVVWPSMLWHVVCSPRYVFIILSAAASVEFPAIQQLVFGHSFELW